MNELIGYRLPLRVSMPQTDAGGSRDRAVRGVVTLVRLAPIAAVPVALIIFADRHGADERHVPVGQAGLFRPGVELLLDLGEVALRCRRRRNIEAGVAQTGGHVLRRDEGVVAEKPEQHLSAGAAEPAA